MAHRCRCLVLFICVFALLFAVGCDSRKAASESKTLDVSAVGSTVSGSYIITLNIKLPNGQPASNAEIIDIHPFPSGSMVPDHTIGNQVLTDGTVQYRYSGGPPPGMFGNSVGFNITVNAGDYSYTGRCSAKFPEEKDSTPTPTAAAAAESPQSIVSGMTNTSGSRYEIREADSDFKYSLPGDWSRHDVPGMTFKMAFGPEGITGRNISFRELTFADNLAAFLAASLQDIEPAYSKNGVTDVKIFGQSAFATNADQIGFRIFISGKRHDGVVLKQIVYVFQGTGDNKIAAVCTSDEEADQKIFDSIMKTVKIAQ